MPIYEFNKKSGSYKDPGYIMKDGHTMFLEDVVKDINAMQRKIAELESRLEATRLINLDIQDDSDSMLEALKDVIEFDSLIVEDKAYKKWCGVFDKIEHAIAKAEGKQC